MNRAPRIGKSFVPGGVYDPKNQRATRNAYVLPTCGGMQEPPSLEPKLDSSPQQQRQPQITPRTQPITLAPPIISEQSASSVDKEMDLSIPENSGAKLPFKQIFITRKKSSVRAKERKIRQNRQLRRAIFPKNALMALNEVKGIITSDFVINSTEDGFVAIITVNSKQYEGHGISKVAAKNSACEKALRDYVIEKMRQKPRKSQSQSAETIDTNGNDSDSTMDSQKVSADDEDVPMVNLASFALYKLFSEWESEGFLVPELHPEVQGGNGENCKVPVKEPKKIPIRNELPNGWEMMHPATLLCMMRPGVTYMECGITGEKCNTLQKIGVAVDDVEFIGVGRSKKIARRNAAAATCNKLFGTNFLIEVPMAY